MFLFGDTTRLQISHKLPKMISPSNSWHKALLKDMSLIIAYYTSFYITRSPNNSKWIPLWYIYLKSWTDSNLLLRQWHGFLCNEHDWAFLMLQVPVHPTMRMAICKDEKYSLVAVLDLIQFFSKPLLNSISQNKVLSMCHLNMYHQISKQATI